MSTVHVAPSAIAADGIRAALRVAGDDAEVLAYHDDLSCGPIDTAALLRRTEWWATAYVGDYARMLREEEDGVVAEGWWQRVAGDVRSVVWVGRRSAREVAFLLWFAAQMGQRAFYVVDVTEPDLRSAGSGGTAAARIPVSAMATGTGTHPVGSVAELSAVGLAGLLGTERPVAGDERDELARSWTALQADNAAFRVMSAAGLRSVPLDYFDRDLLDHIHAHPTPIGLVIAETMAVQSYPVMDYVLQQRLIDLIDVGRIAADGDPTIASQCRVWALPR
ncbi:DUF3658 domain-containing protein [Nocardia sp. NPDC050175]|uniref:DUF3658 domain-containing protein n=1 Tax=Nocardia sp. NPDC050175 TaxID=3364317 RepID=UPI00378C1993